FHKGRELYALYETRRSTSNLKRLLIVEGYMDAVRLHQYGINYAVATLGTATTPEHFKRIFRIVSEVVFAFDGDRAGRAAAWRALQHACPRRVRAAKYDFYFCLTDTIPTLWWVRKAGRLLSDDSRRHCRCLNISSRSSRSSPI